MASNYDLTILNEILERERAQRGGGLSKNEFFGVYTCEQVLKELEPSYDQINDADVDGGDDGAVDYVFTTLDGRILRDDSEIVALPNAHLDLYLIQSKDEESFKETPLNRLNVTLSHFLDIGRPPSDFGTAYNTSLVEQMERFRDAYKFLAPRFPAVTIHLIYATRGSNPHPNVKALGATLAKTVGALLPRAVVTFDLLGATDIVGLAQTEPPLAREVKFAKEMLLEDDFVVLVPLHEFNKFVSDDNGTLIQRLLDANVRDFEGAVARVNEEILDTLHHPERGDFWWFNNGITVLATKASAAHTLWIENPQIVNGLQTTVVINKFFLEPGAPTSDSRHVLLRVIVSEDDTTRERIIKATNSQTPIRIASLRAIDDLHRQIELHLKAQGFSYERRRNYYKNRGVTRDDILSVEALTQTLASGMLHWPDEARARVSNLLKDDGQYAKIFSPDNKIEVYVRAAQLSKRVERFLRGQAIPGSARNNFRQHLATAVSILALGSTEVRRDDFAGVDFNQISDNTLDQALQIVRTVFEEIAGETALPQDRIAKSHESAARLIEVLAKEMA